MAKKALFEGLVFDENNFPVSVVYVGEEPCYVVDDNGFRRHIPSEQVDRQVLEQMRGLINGNEKLISEEAAKMLGQDDIFSKAFIESQLVNIDKQFDHLLETGIIEDSRTYMGMTGFRIIVNVHGEIVEIHQPGMTDPYEDE
jgi:hypothetical protein